MKESITRENLANYLSVFFENNEVSIENVAKSIGCSYKEYKKLSKADKERISESIGAVGGSILGFGTISAAISSSGTIIGLSAAGITSGLSAIGTLVGGGMVAGITAIAVIPLAFGAAGYGIMKGIKTLITYSKINDKEINDYWEIRKET